MLKSDTIYNKIIEEKFNKNQLIDLKNKVEEDILNKKNENNKIKKLIELIKNFKPSEKFKELKLMEALNWLKNLENNKKKSIIEKINNLKGYEYNLNNLKNIKLNLIKKIEIIIQKINNLFIKINDMKELDSFINQTLGNNNFINLFLLLFLIIKLFKIDYNIIEKLTLFKKIFDNHILNDHKNFKLITMILNNLKNKINKFLMVDNLLVKNEFLEFSKNLIITNYLEYIKNNFVEFCNKISNINNNYKYLLTYFFPIILQLKNFMNKKNLQVFKKDIINIIKKNYKKNGLQNYYLLILNNLKENNLNNFDINNLNFNFKLFNYLIKIDSDSEYIKDLNNEFYEKLKEFMKYKEEQIMNDTTIYKEKLKILEDRNYFINAFLKVIKYQNIDEQNCKIRGNLINYETENLKSLNHISRIYVSKINNLLTTMKYEGNLYYFPNDFNREFFNLKNVNPNNNFLINFFKNLENDFIQLYKIVLNKNIKMKKIIINDILILLPDIISKKLIKIINLYK